MTPDTQTAPAETNLALPAAHLPDGAHPQAWIALGRTHVADGRLPQARDALLECLEAWPSYVPALLELGRVLVRIGDLPAAAECFAQAAELAPEEVVGLAELARALADCGRHADAVEAWGSVVQARPHDYPALNNLGLALSASGRTAEAETAFRGALDLAPTIAEIHANLAELLHAQMRVQEAHGHYMAAVQGRPDWPEAWNNLGITARLLGEVALAEAALRNALELRPGYVAALYNLGNVLNRPGHLAEARLSYAAVVAARPDHAEALYGLGNVSADPAEAARWHRRALEARPGFAEAVVGLACASLEVCDWSNLALQVCEIEALVRERPDAAVAPFAFVQLSADPVLQLACARNWVRTRLEPLAARQGALRPLPQPGSGRRERLRIGYLSADFRNHAVGHLVADLFRLHDRQRFEIHGYSTGPDDGSEVRARIAAGFDRFIDVRDLSARPIAERIRDDGIDILVDLNGHTKHSRSEVLALRAAPVQVSYLGFPGTMGASFVDALLSDAFLTPQSCIQYYQERLVELPLCYQVSAEASASPPPDRAQLGLPERGFVFCCFNNSYKFRPELFDVWMRLLGRVPGSVLWLAAFNPTAQDNLRREAAARGIDPARLIVSPVVSIAEHARRLPAADLFLDTHPYSAGATASQTLQAGVPLLTMVGLTYASRMAGSLLDALGLQELIMTSLEEYESAAIALARDSDKIADLRMRLKRAQQRTRLFDATRATRALESAYGQLWTAQRQGQHARTPLRVSPDRS